MVTRTMWMVRAGENGYLFNDFKNKSVVAIGWNDVGDLSKVSKPEDIKQIVKEKYPDYKVSKLNITAGQLARFRFDFKKGDYVITYNPEKRIYLVGEIAGDYEYNTRLTEYFHVRRVKWLGEIPRDMLSTTTKNTLGSISTLFEVNKSAKEEILQVLGKKKGDIESIENVEEEMEELVAGILRGMGYKTIITPKGPDRGRDIYASPDGLGLEDPRIIVEVKHRTGQVSGKEMRSFIGGLRHGTKGLYVSTGGFSKDARYEAERSNIPVTLVDLDMLAKLITQYYDNFDEEAKKLIPLIKIYWPA